AGHGRRRRPGILATGDAVSDAGVLHLHGAASAVADDAARGAAAPSSERLTARYVGSGFSRIGPPDGGPHLVCGTLRSTRLPVTPPRYRSAPCRRASMVYWLTSRSSSGRLNTS